MDTQTSRFKSLETQVRFLRMALIMLAIVGVVAVLMGAAASWDSVRTGTIIVPRASGVGYSHCLTVEAEGGQKMAEFRLSNQGPVLWLYDNTGRLVLHMGATANDYGGYLELEGKPGENSRLQLAGRGVHLMGRQVGEAIVPWMSLYRQPNLFNGLEIYGEGDEMIKLDNRDGAPRVEIIDAEGKATNLMP